MVRIRRKLVSLLFIGLVLSLAVPFADAAISPEVAVAMHEDECPPDRPPDEVWIIGIEEDGTLLYGAAWENEDGTYQTWVYQEDNGEAGLQTCGDNRDSIVGQIG